MSCTIADRTSDAGCTLAPKRTMARSTATCSKSRWGRIIPRRTACFGWTSCSTARRVVKLKPVFGYLHRNHEKIGENTSYLGSMPYTDRLDYFCSMTNNWAYALGVEKLAGLQVPERAEYIRVITAELTRLQNHASPRRLSAAGHGRAGHAADVCVSRARKNSRSVRSRSPARA